MGKEREDRLWRNFVSYSLCIAISVCSVILLTPKESLAANTSVGVQVCNTATSAPTLTSPSGNATTQDSSIILSGSGAPSTTIYAFRNSTQVGYVTSAGDGSFSISVALVVGSNVLKVAVLDECSEYVFSSTVTITRQATPTPPTPSPSPPSGGSGSSSGGDTSSGVGSSLPTTSSGSNSDAGSKDSTKNPPGNTPLISFPRDGDKFNGRNVIVAGHASPLTKVKIYLNGRLVAEVLSDDQGQFSASVYLLDGKNQIQVRTGSGSGLRKSTVIYAYYRPDIFTIVSSWWPWIWILILLSISTFFLALFLIFRRHKKND